ncbi:hypothetical protein ACO0SA_003897 [Hanseniaspora valbyensis]
MVFNVVKRQNILLFKSSLKNRYSSTIPSIQKFNNDLNKRLVYAEKLNSEKINTQFVSIYGPDTVEFLNGMITTKLKDKYVKKNLMTINDEDDFKTDKNVMDDLKMLSQTNPLVDDILRFEDNKMIDKNETIEKMSLYDELQESYGNTKGQLTALLNSKSRIISLIRLYTPFIMRRGHKYKEIILELPKLQSKSPENELDDENDPIKILAKHSKLSKIKFNVDILNDSKLGFDVWEIYFKGSIIRNDFELEILNNIIEDSRLNYNFNKQFHFNEILNQKNDSIISVFLDDVFYNCSLVDSQDGELFYKYKVLTKKNEVTTVEDIIQDNISIEIDPEMPSIIKELTKKYGLYDLNDINPSTLLPLDLALEYSPNCVSFDKGCYIGQELTTRMHSTNKIIKRCVPITIKNDSNAEIVEGWGIHTDSTIKENDNDSLKAETSNSVFGSSKPLKKRNKPIGKLVVYNEKTSVALVTMKLDYLKDFYYLNNPENRTFYLLPPKEKIKKLSNEDIEKVKIDIVLNKPYWIEEYISEVEEQEALENEQYTEEED